LRMYLENINWDVEEEKEIGMQSNADNNGRKTLNIDEELYA